MLTKSISENPINPEAHLEVAKIYIGIDEMSNSKLIIEHLKRSFSEGDTNYDAQFWYARHNFLYGDKFESNRICKQLSRAKLPSRIKYKVKGLVKESDGGLAKFEGKINSKQESFCFAYVESINADVYLHYKAFSQNEWNELHETDEVKFNLGFNLNGSCGVNAKILKKQKGEWVQAQLVCE